MMLKTADGETCSRLEELPAELRTIIYSFAVVEVAPVNIDKMFEAGIVDAGCQPPLARTSRQVRAEVLPIFYAENTFVAGISSTVYSVAGTLDFWLSLTLPYLKYLRSFGGFLVEDGRTVYLFMRIETSRTECVDKERMLEKPQSCTCLLDAAMDALGEEKQLTANRVKSIMRAANLDLIRTTRCLGRLDFTDVAPHAACSLHRERARTASASVDKLQQTSNG